MLIIVFEELFVVFYFFIHSVFTVGSVRRLFKDLFLVSREILRSIVMVHLIVFFAWCSLGFFDFILSCYFFLIFRFT